MDANLEVSGGPLPLPERALASAGRLERRSGRFAVRRGCRVLMALALALTALGGQVEARQGSGGGLGPPPEFDPVEEYLTEARQAREAGRFNDALEVLTRAADEVPEDFDSDLLLWRGRVLNDLGQFEEALSTLQKLQQLDRGRGSAGRLELVRSLRGAGQRRQAESMLYKLLEDYPRCGPARVQLVDLLVEQGQSGQAQAQLDTLLAQVPSLAWAIALKARLAARAGDVDAALNLLREGLDADDTKQSLRAVLVELLIEHDRSREAWLQSKILIQSTQDPLHYELAARAAQAADEPFDAFAALIQAQRLAPERQSTIDALLLLLGRADDVRDRLALQRAQLTPDDPKGWAQAMDGRIANGRSRGAIELYEGLPSELQRDSELQLALSEALRGVGDFERALRVIDPLCTDPPGADTLALAAWFERALTEAELGRPESAILSFQKAAVGDIAPEAHFNRGLVLLGIKRYTEAERAYEAAVRALDAFPEAWLELGNVRRAALGKTGEALTAYRKYLDLVGSDPEIEALLNNL